MIQDDVFQADRLNTTIDIKHLYQITQKHKEETTTGKYCYAFQAKQKGTIVGVANSWTFNALISNGRSGSISLKRIERIECLNDKIYWVNLQSYKWQEIRCRHSTQKSGRLPIGFYNLQLGTIHWPCGRSNDIAAALFKILHK